MPDDESDRRKRGRDLFDDIFGKGGAFDGIFGEGGALDRALGGAEETAEDAERKERGKSSEGDYWAKRYWELTDKVIAIADVDKGKSVTYALNALVAQRTSLRGVLAELGVDHPGPRPYQDQVADQVRHAISQTASEYRDALESIERLLGWDPQAFPQRSSADIVEEVGEYVRGIEAMKARALTAEDSLIQARGALLEAEGALGAARSPWPFAECWDELRQLLGEPEGTTPDMLVGDVRAFIEVADQNIDQNHIARSQIERAVHEAVTDPEITDVSKVVVTKLWNLLTEHDLGRPPFVALGAGDVIRVNNLANDSGIDPHVAVSYDLTSGRWVFNVLDGEGEYGSSEWLAMRRARDESFEQVQARSGRPALVVEDRSAHTFGIVDDLSTPEIVPEAKDPRLDRLITLLVTDAQDRGDHERAEHLRSLRGKD